MKSYNNPSKTVTQNLGQFLFLVESNFYFCNLQNGFSAISEDLTNLSTGLYHVVNCFNGDFCYKKDQTLQAKQMTIQRMVT